MRGYSLKMTKKMSEENVVSPPGIDKDWLAPAIRSLEELSKLKQQLIVESNFLIENFQHLEPSTNTVFVLGTLDYCRIALKKENLNDVVQKGHLLSVIKRYIEKNNELQDCFNEEPKVLSGTRLDNLRADFMYLQDVCSRYGILPALNDENLDLSELLLEE
jgi:cell fate (sporulation/competence/biofilm development) regulator YlbF (YheA/YmcA/DUF963 family)